MKNIYKVNLLIFVLFVSSLSFVFSRSGGITGQTNSGCGGGSCHGSSSSNTTVTISSSGGFEVNPDATVSLTVSVENSSGQTKAGVNIAVHTTSSGSSNAGTLTAGSDLSLSSNELIHKTTGGKAISSGKATFDFQWKAPSTAGEYYIKAAVNATNANGNTGGDQWALMTPKKITVRGLNLTSLNGGQQLCAGSNNNITWSQFAVENVKIELSTNGGSSYDQTIIASTSASAGTYAWTIPSNLNGTTFKIKISDASNSSISKESTSNFSIFGDPIISSHPENSTKCSGEDVTFNISASGKSLTYQWYKNDAEINGKTQSTLSLVGITSADAADYYCKVTSECGSPKNSDVAILTVTDSPKIITISNDKTMCIGGDYTISVEATGNNITYQWFKENVAISNETNASFQIVNAKASDNSQYKVEVNSPTCGKVTSKFVKITIDQVIEITNNPIDTNVCEDGALIISTKAIGTNLEYKWLFNNVEIPNSNNSILVVEQFKNANVGKYKCKVKNSCGEVFTTESTVGINFLPTITNNSDDISVNEGNAITLSIDATGDDLIYEWYLDEVLISNQSGKDIIINNIRKLDEGNYICRVYNSCGFVDSKPIKVTVTNPGTGGILELSEEIINFGEVINGKKKDLLFEEFFKNIGDDILTVSSVKIKSSNSVYSLKEIFTFGLNPKEVKELLITFRPTKAQNYNDTLVIMQKDIPDPILIPINGVGIDIDITAEVVSSEIKLDFGDIIVGSTSEKSLNLENKSTLNSATLSSIVFSIPEFTLKNSLNLPLEINKSSVQNVDLLFTPTLDGDFEGLVTFNFLNSDKIDIILNGTSTIASVTNYFESIKVYPNPSNDFITLKVNSLSQQEFKLSLIDMNGNIVKDFGKQYFTKGQNELNWNGFDESGNKVSNGAYNLLIINKNINIIEKIMVK